MRTPRIAMGLVVATGLWQSGCATTAPSPERRLTADNSYSAGRAIQDFALPANKVGEALTAAMDDLKMTAIEPGRDGAVYKIDAKTADDRTVMVTMRPRQGQTRLSCRIGWFGDEALSKALLERTGVRLGTLPPAAVPEDPPSTPGSNPFFSRDAVPDEEMLRDVAEAPYRDRVIP
jgi:Protein of unknown function (DUF3568)